MSSMLAQPGRRRLGMQFVLAAGLALAFSLLFGACAQIQIEHPSTKPLSKEAMSMLGAKGMTAAQPIFVRVFKEESELEVWKQRSDGRYYLFKSYPICHWSGELGPKLKQGDKQAPEGFYTVKKEQMNPNSQFHLAFNLGFPNSFDRAHKRTGDFLMVHGKCKSAGCYAMTDALMEEIYALARDSFAGGQDTFQVHAYPFRMTPENMARHAQSPWLPFWQTLKEGYDHFELTRLPPDIVVCQKNYVVNAKLARPQKLDPDAACPKLERPEVQAFTPLPAGAEKAPQRSSAAAPAEAATAQ